MKLPSEILAFKLLRKANIGKEEKMLVLIGMNYANKETLYEEAKTSLKKIKGDFTEGKASSNLSIKLEPAFLAENEEVLLAVGYSKQYRGKTGRSDKGSYNHGNQHNHGHQPARKMNLMGPDGKILTCRCSGSYRHLVAKCPHCWENMSKTNVTERMAKVNITEDELVLFTGYHKGDIAQLGIDARNCAVSDSACSSTVCGEIWQENYLNSLDHEDRRKIKRSIDQKTFKFGGGERLKSKGEYNLPAVIAGKEVTVKTDVVESDIPLLLSRQAVKTAGVRMDLESDTAQIFDKDIAFNLTTSGHYCIPIDRAGKIPVQKVFSVDIEEMASKDRYKTLFRLHRQFAHPPMKKLKSLLQDADQWKDEYSNLLEDIDNKCELCKCKWYAKTPSRSVVGLPMASQFNEKVSMDLKQWNGHWIFHIIDMWSRYTVSVFINRKKPSDVIDTLMQRWISVFGKLRSIVTDNGGGI